jgi:hypothetical protein
MLNRSRPPRLVRLQLHDPLGSKTCPESQSAQQCPHSRNSRYAGPLSNGVFRSDKRRPHWGHLKPRASANTTPPTTQATNGQGDDISPAATIPPKNTANPRANAHQGPLGNVLTSDIREVSPNGSCQRRRATGQRFSHLVHSRNSLRRNGSASSRCSTVWGRQAKCKKDQRCEAGYRQQCEECGEADAVSLARRHEQ